MNAPTDTLAREFSAALKTELSVDEMVEVVRLNRVESNPHICHSADFCDTNMVLHEVFMKYGMDVADEGGVEKWGALWNETWDKAKAAEFWMN